MTDPSFANIAISTEGVEAGLLRRLVRSPSFMIGAVITAIVILAAFVSYFWTPYDPTAMAIPDRLKGPSASHIFGTDQFGRDIFSMIMVGARNSIAVSVFSVGIGVIVGVPLGLAAAARSGLLDELVMRMNDLVFAFPALLTAVMLAAIIGPGTLGAVIAIGVFNIPVFARLARGSALSVLAREFILASRASGKGTTLILVEHVLPNIMNTLIVQATIQFSLGILLEAGLSYVGLGTPPPFPSWGRMLNDAQTLMATAPHLALFPGLAIVFAVLGLNLLGDGLRDALDPRLSGGRAQS
jgi:peptide/nickel transport system permease protein